MPKLTRTFQTRIEGDHPVLGAVADLFSRVARKVDAALARGENPRTIAKTFWEPNGVSGKNLDHILRQVQAKRKAVIELSKVQVEDLRTRIAAKERQIAKKRKRKDELPAEIEALRTRLDDANLIGKARKQASGALRKAVRTLNALPFALHQHRRRLDILQHKLAAAEARAERPGICHGSRELFLKQHHLTENGYADHPAWKRDWQATRSSQFMVEGAASQPSGNQFIRCKAMPDGTIDLEVRMPLALHNLAKRRWNAGVKNDPVAAIDLRGLRFTHGHEQILAALKTKRPLTWRFVRDKTSWRVMVMIGLDVAEKIGTDWSQGALGVDLNADHVSLCHVDPKGNPLQVWRMPLVTFGLSEGQRLDLVRKAAQRILALALELSLPVVSEKLDFGKKKAELTSDHGPAYARALSSFAYRSFHNALRSALVRAGVRHVVVNAAYTSLIGRVKFARPLGLIQIPPPGTPVGRSPRGNRRPGHGFDAPMPQVSRRFLWHRGVNPSCAPRVGKASLPVRSRSGGSLVRGAMGGALLILAVAIAGAAGASVREQGGRFPETDRTALGLVDGDRETGSVQFLVERDAVDNAPDHEVVAAQTWHEIRPRERIAPPEVVQNVLSVRGDGNVPGKIIGRTISVHLGTHPAESVQPILLADKLSVYGDPSRRCLSCIAKRKGCTTIFVGGVRAANPGTLVADHSVPGDPYGLPYVLALFHGVGKHPSGEEGEEPRRDGEDQSPERRALLAAVPLFAVMGTALSYMAGCVFFFGGSVHIGVGLFVLAAAVPLHVAGSLFLPPRYKPFGAPIWRKSTGYDT